MNRRTFLAAALGTAVAPGRVLAAAQGGGFVALVTADLESHVAAVEVGSGRIVRRIRTAAGPRSIEGSPYGAAVVAHTAAGVVSLLDTTTLSVHSVLGGFGEPRYTAIHPSERLAYVTDSRRRDVATIDLVRRAVVHRVPVPGPARHVSLDAGGRFLWTSLGTKAERIAVLDLTDTRRPRSAASSRRRSSRTTSWSRLTAVTSGSRRDRATRSRSTGSEAERPGCSPPTPRRSTSASPSGTPMSRAERTASSACTGSTAREFARLASRTVRTTSRTGRRTSRRVVRPR
jgi:hypothetical protein